MTINYSTMYGLNSETKGATMNNRYTMPKELATNENEFRELFYNLPNSDWGKCKGNALIHILIYDLDELMLNTPGEWSREVQDEKAQLMEFIRLDLGISSQEYAYWIINNLYVPTAEEYEYLTEKEDGKSSCNDPIVKGVYPSSLTMYTTATSKAREKLLFKSDEEGIEYFNFSIARWNDVHQAIENNQIAEALGITPEELDIESADAEIRARIEAEWNAMTPEQRQWWRD